MLVLNLVAGSVQLKSISLLIILIVDNINWSRKFDLRHSPHFKMTTLNIIAFTCLVIVVSCQSQGRPGGPPGPPGGGPPGMPFPLMPQGGGVGSGGQQGSKSGSEGGGKVLIYISPGHYAYFCFEVYASL